MSLETMTAAATTTITSSAGLAALDLALAPSFLISYSVLALVQLNMLFCGHYVRFAITSIAAFSIVQVFGFIDFSAFCAHTKSQLICANHAQGLIAFGRVWVYVSFAMIALFGINRTITVVQNRRSLDG